jgi:hypothetical protein
VKGSELVANPRGSMEEAGAEPRPSSLKEPVGAEYGYPRQSQRRRPKDEGRAASPTETPTPTGS